MAMVALIMRPWVMQMEALDVVPRCLADDLMFTTYGVGHRARCIRAMRESRQYFKDIGARVADNKCFTFATDQRTRTMLSTMDWDGNGLKIPVKNSFRDLGAHINLTKACNGSTLTSRLIKATNMAKRLRWLPISREQKEKIVQANILPMALYGVEAIHVNQSALQSLRSAITRAIGPGSAKRSIDLTFFHSKCANDLDPETNILYLRAAGLRRVIAKHAGMHPLVKRIIRKIKIAQAIENPDDNRNTHMHGPVGLFMQELDQLAYSMDEHLNIFAPNEPTIQLWHMPWQHIRKAITAIGIRFRARRIDNERTFHAHVGEVDGLATKYVSNKLGRKERSIHMHLTTGAFWAEDQLQTISVSDGKCPHCQQPVVGTRHVLWDCHAIKKHKKFRKFVDINPDALPTCVQNGIAPALSSKASDPYWDSNLCQSKDICKEDAHLIGQPFTSGAKYHANLEDKMLQDVCNKAGIAGQGLNARQTFMLLKENKQTPHIPMPYRCKLHAPQEINVFTDGSWLFPLKQFLGLGGAGVWWPGRKLRGHPLSEPEIELAYVTEHDRGIRLFTRIGGFAGSSTRTELAAGIIAISSHGPMHIGSDSKVFVDFANTIVFNSMHNIPMNCNWKLISDGDLWEHFFLAVKAKGAHAVRLSWIKAHATQDHINAGVTDAIKKLGNDEADATADLGTAMFGQDLIDAARRFNKKHKDYQWFMLDVAKHLIESYMIHRELLRIHEAKLAKLQAQAEKCTVYKPLVYASSASTSTFHFTSSIHCYQSALIKQPWLIGVENFLRTLMVEPCGEGIRGITWIELYIHYRQTGFRKPIPNSEHVALARATFDKQLRAFTNAVRYVVARILLGSEECAWFKPSIATVNPLEGIALQGRFPALSFNVHLDSAHASNLAATLLKFGRNISKSRINDFIDFGGKLKYVKCVRKGKAAWDDSITVVSTPSSNIRTDEGQSQPPLDSSTREAAFYKCPHCTHVEQSSAINFPYSDLDKRVKCSICKRHSASKDWTCQCSKLWHQCKAHMRITDGCTKSKASKRHVSESLDSSRVSEKHCNRLRINSYEQLFKEDRKWDIRRHKRRKTLTDDSIIHLGDMRIGPLPSGLLTPALALRFPSCCTDRSN